MASLKNRLTEILINNNLLTPQQLDRALQLHKKKGGRLSDIIVELQFMREPELVSLLNKELGFPQLDLRRVKIDCETAKLLPRDVARHYLIIPVSKLSDTITMAMADPLNIFALEHIGTLKEYRINPLIFSRHQVLQALESAYVEEKKDDTQDQANGIVRSSFELIREDRDTIPTGKELEYASRQPLVIQATDKILEGGEEKVFGNSHRAPAGARSHPRA